MNKNRYALLTVDTEALPQRATDGHVTKLMWGKHEKGTAGVGTMASIGDEFSAKHIFFFDMCGCFPHLDEELEVAKFLHEAGQDVQLHTHPEYLPKSFWDGAKLPWKPKLLNQYKNAVKEDYLISYFSQKLASVTGESPRAFRAGSFRWNGLTLRVLKKYNIQLDFSNSITAKLIGQNPYSVPTSKPFRWSNGIIEVPTTEKNVLAPLAEMSAPQFLPVRMASMWKKVQTFSESAWARFQYPLSAYVKYRPSWLSFLPYSVSKRDGFLVCLIHSWSLLYWDENGHAEYRDDRKIEGYRKLLRQLTKDYDVITSKDFLDLVALGKIAMSHTEDLGKAEI